MRKNLSRMLALMLTLAMLAGILPAGVFAADSKLTLTVSDQTGRPGETVSIKIDIADNPGITSLKFDVKYDSMLTLKNTEFGSDFQSSGLQTDANPSRGLENSETVTLISWASDISTNGTLITLTFEISKNAPDNYVADIIISYDEEEVFNEQEESIALDVKSGSVTVYHGIPGDINADSSVNTKDAILLFRYVAGRDVSVDTAALDVNGDNKVNTKDAVALFRYVAGRDVVLYRGEICVHKLIHNSAKAAKCDENGNIEFWLCELCGRVYSDENCKTQINRSDTSIEAIGHSTVIDEPVSPTYTSTGLTQGSHCENCSEILVAQQTIPALTGTNYSITYDLFGSDTYLAKIGVENSNPNTYISEVGVLLEDVSSPGYVFKGWKTSDDKQVSKIDANTVGNIKLYAQWEKVIYNVLFDSPDVPVESATYTVDSGITLTAPSWYGYTFVGWSNDNGFIVSRIKEGTTGNITLHANWTSNRNRATSYTSYGDPIIIEDSKSGQFLFVYDIGKIDNVPLYQIGFIGNHQRLDMTVSYEYTDTITSEQAELIANTVSNATTRSSGWTLSEEWNQIYASEEESQDLQTKSEERTDSEGNTVGGKYFVSNSNGGSTYVSNESGGSNSSSSKVTTDRSFGINSSYDKSTEKYVDGKLSVSNSLEVSAGVEVPIGIVNVNAGIKATTTMGAELSSGRKDSTASHVDSSYSDYVGTVNTSNSSSYFTTVKNNSNTWNSDEGYEKSKEVSANTEISAAISSQISKKTSYNISDSLGGQNSKTASVDEEELKSNEYQSSLKYSVGTSITSTHTKKYTVDAEGYYRVVMAGTIHVYGVVGYDIATGSYYTYTFNVLDDERHEYLDYSKDNANFNDCENGVVTFEIPYEVNEYIVAVTARTDGTEVDLDGNITGFEATEDFDGTVFVPQYYSVNNGDNTFTAYLTKAIDACAFRGNTELKTVILPIGITEIPAGAFEGCTKLETVIAYGVTKIGNNAFKGCTSLSTFSIDNIVTSIGENAFEGCPEVAAMVANASVANAVINSGAKRITIDLTKISDSFDNRKITISDSTEYFAIYGGGKSFTSLQIESDSNETFISNMTLVGNTDTPLKLGSSTIKFARVSVENAPGFALISTAENVEIKLLGNVNFGSKGTNTVISKNATFSKLDSSVSGHMNISGKYLVYGDIANDSMLSATGGVERIDSEMFNRKLTSCSVTFNANGGNVSDSSKTVYYGQSYGTLPTPTRDNYTFDGWYTVATGGNLITANTVVDSLVNITLYAHWTPNAFTVYFDANGGYVSPSSKSMVFGNILGKLPTPSKTNYTFAGWYTSDGAAVGASFVPTTAADITLYAHWTPNAFIVSFDANGGYVSESSRTMTFGNSLGTLPTPTRDYYNFIGWYDVSGNRLYASTVPTSATNSTLYAYWELKPESGWIKATALPSGAQVTSRKWTYTQAYYTTSSSSSLSGWTHYNTTSTWGDYGSWSTWQDASVSSSDSRQVETQQVVDKAGYYEYRYGRRNSTYHWTFCVHGQNAGVTYTTKYSDWSTTRYYDDDGTADWKCGACGKSFYTYKIGNQIYYWEETRYIEPTYKTQYRYRDRSLIYTYHFSRTENLESSSYPNTANVSNIVEWVKYREK